MNTLAKIKLFNHYDLTVNNLYKEDEPTVPITDVEGSTALLLTDGTSWELVDGSWEQIEENLDKKINLSIYPFITSICNSIHNHFILPLMSHCYKKATLSINSLDDTASITIGDSATDELIEAIADDFVIIHTKSSQGLTCVTSVVDTSEERKITVDNNGLNLRISGQEECARIDIVSFPPDFIETIYAMLAYDLFERDGKEVRQERLGNYSVINFAPSEFQGEDSYPKHLVSKIKYWQFIPV